MNKPEIYSEAEWRMVQGYMHGKDGLAPKQSGACYMHGYNNGRDDRHGTPRDRADVLRRRADMILSSSSARVTA